MGRPVRMPKMARWVVVVYHTFDGVQWDDCRHSDDRDAMLRYVIALREELSSEHRVHMQLVEELGWELEER